MMQQHRLTDEQKRKGTTDSLKINVMPRVAQSAGSEQEAKKEQVRHSAQAPEGTGIGRETKKPVGRGLVAVADAKNGPVVGMGQPGQALTGPQLRGGPMVGAAREGPGRAVRPGLPAAPPAPPAGAELAEGVPVRVHLTRTGKIETVPLEQYVTGVLAAEMPADFELAALKAQAIAARTYIVRRLARDETGDMAGRAADVNDTTAHQAYLSRAVLLAWPEQGKAAQLAKLQEAVRQTEGIVMTFRGQPITAVFFSSSGGYTENSEEYWSLKVPYLRSVASPWDAQIHPESKETIELPLTQLYRKLGQPVPKTVQSAIAVFAQEEGKKEMKLKVDKLFQILSWTTGRRVKEIRIGEKTYSGRELREKLELRSSQFTLALSGDKVKITTYGYGHGVGMSQWGANGMAKQGFTTTQILKHYYTGIDFEQASSFLKKI
ncbi:stage II sporulation protein D [Paenibacillus senegalimassiliensis]|uniref:stage II sporulation protein D n=1 Tax=Paenibacillus senegalimassiliensis TaxID=1737426 RepID=UPI000AA066EC|nr:stage II sporulation protein D [Paenibacillus senegalimassiliensis]